MPDFLTACFDNETTVKVNLSKGTQMPKKKIQCPVSLYCTALSLSHRIHTSLSSNHSCCFGSIASSERIHSHVTGPRPNPLSAEVSPPHSPSMLSVENKVPRDSWRDGAVMASPGGKGTRSWQEVAGGGIPRRDAELVNSVEDAEGLYVAVERCPLCNTTRRRLTCAKCVQSGDFVFFDGRDTER